MQDIDLECRYRYRYRYLDVAVDASEAPANILENVHETGKNNQREILQPTQLVNRNMPGLRYGAKGYFGGSSQDVTDTWLITMVS